MFPWSAEIRRFERKDLQTGRKLRAEKANEIAAVLQPSRDWILLTTSCNLEMFAFSFLVNFWLR